MSSLETLQSAEAFVSGRALPAAMVCHRRLAEQPLVICLFSLGAEPFSVAAVQWGTEPGDPRRAVAGEPRNRDLLFASLLNFAGEFNAYFDAAWATHTVRVNRKGREIAEVAEPPQILVPNRESIMLLGRLGRRLRFVEGAPDELLCLGAHLAFLREHAVVAGQQLIVAATELNDVHFHMALNDWERGSLAAQDMAIEPPAGAPGHAAAAEIDITPIGPRPDATQDDRLRPLLERFNRDRAGATDPATVNPLLGAIEAHYEALLADAWRLTWRTRERLLEARSEARMVRPRVAADAEEYVRHMQLMDQGIRRRTRQSVSQAIALRARWEDSNARLGAQQAYDDPLQMVDVLLSGQAMIGAVLDVDLDHHIQGPKKMVRRPRIELELDGSCPFLPGELVHWDVDPERNYEIETVTPRPGGGDLVAMLLRNPDAPVIPAAGQVMCVATLSVTKRYRGGSAANVPWPYAAPSVATDGDIDAEEAA
ncbi:MAG: hypothetical protein QOF69_228 [Solirubrobacteraceae bacterium]|nr:hypothetical protein [Solirubrobacteraceae bacterium]